MEIWKDVVGYEGIYEVSSYGRVRTHKNKTTWNKRYGIAHWEQRYLKNKNPKGRDVRVSLWKNGTHKDFLVHRLVAQAFITMIYGKQDINHIDGDPKNNNVENLEWCNHKENNNHAFDNNLIKTGVKIKLIDQKGSEYKFRSFTKANEFIGRNHDYINQKIKSNKPILSRNGEEYKCERIF